jgi:hypothetical protein
MAMFMHTPRLVAGALAGQTVQTGSSRRAAEPEVAAGTSIVTRDRGSTAAARLVRLPLSVGHRHRGPGL